MKKPRLSVTLDYTESIYNFNSKYKDLYVTALHNINSLTIYTNHWKENIITGKQNF